MNETYIVSNLQCLLDREAIFNTIYADPPWRYDNTAARGAAGKHYDGTLTVDEICALPVDQLAGPEAHLYLWTTNGFLFEAFRVIRSWGFEFEGTMVWLKKGIGTGNYWRNAHELLMVCIRPGAAPPSDDMPGTVMTRRGRHSAKPEQFRHIIERFSPGPRLELFGRLPVPGWTVFGNQVGGGLPFQDVRELE